MRLCDEALWGRVRTQSRRQKGMFPRSAEISNKIWISCLLARRLRSRGGPYPSALSRYRTCLSGSVGVNLDLSLSLSSRKSLSHVRLSLSLLC